MADARSIGQAALSLAVSQPTMSRRLVALEDLLGQPVFERSPRGLSLTPAGRLLLEPARRMQREAVALQRAVAEHAHGLQGTVRITASQVVSAYLLPPILRDLRLAHPDIQIELVATDSVEDLIEREADIAVRMFRPTQPSLTVRRLADEPLGLYAHPAYIARCGWPTPATLRQHEWIGMDRQDTVLRGFARAGQTVTRELFGFRCDHTVVNWEAVKAGLGIGVGLQRVAAQSPDVQRVLDTVPIAPLSMWLAVHREWRATPRLRLVYAFLAERLAQGH